MMDTIRKLRLISYNSTGCNDDKLNYLNAASSDCDIILVQEHWLLSNNLQRIKAGVKGFTGIANSGVDETQVILTGRPYGGCAILWRHEFSPLITPVQVDSLSRRLCSAVLHLTDYRILILCAYFPTDPGTAVYNGADLDVILSDIIDVILNVHCDAIILGGDLNYDTSRNTGFAKSVKSFISGLNLSTLWCKHTVDYTYTHTDGISTSTIDHFMVSNNILNDCESGGVVHSVDNTSNHSLTYMVLNLGQPIDVNTPSYYSAKPKLAWYKASAQDIEGFRECIDFNLQNVMLDDNTILCQDTSCSTDLHKDSLDDYFESLMQVLINSGKHLPQTCSPDKATRVPGWNDLVKPYRDDAIFWKYIYDQMGKPRTGWVAQIMRRTRGQYHYALRRARSQKEQIKKHKLLQSMCSSDRDFFNEIKRIRGHAKTVSSTIDGLHDNEQIADKFSSKYQKLYNSNPSDTNELNHMMDSLNQLLQDSDSYKHCIINIDHIHKALKRLKSDKQDGVYNEIASEHILNATESFYKHLCVLFTTCLVHGYMPHAMTLSTLIPIPKDANDLKNSDKYRGIALSALCTKIFEYIILDMYGHILTSGDLQFAYKSDASTTQCTWVAREVISYYNENGSDVYSCLLDCSKAFDRIRHDKLLYKLMQTDLPPIFIRSLMNMYVNSTIRVKWRDKFSEPFGAINGVKQGSVLSPILFTLCLDDLIAELESKGDGCWVGHKYYGIVGFADDLKLLCPSLKGLQNMLNVCKKFSDSTGLTFNADKTLCIKYHHGKHVNNLIQYPIYLGDIQLKWYSQVKHLGHVFSCCLNFAKDVCNRKGQFIGCVNSIITQFSFAHPACKLRLLVIHGYSFYGSSLWDLYDNACKNLFTTWNIAMRRIFHLPRDAHTRFLSHIAGVSHLKHNLKCRFAKFICNAANSHNSRVSFLASLCMRNTISTTGRNIANIQLEYDIDNVDFTMSTVCNKMSKSYKIKCSLNDETWKCDIMHELIDCINGISHCGLTYDEAMQCLHFIASH